MPTILQVQVTPEGLAVTWRCGEEAERMLCAPNWAQAARMIYEECAPKVEVGIEPTKEWVDALIGAMRKSLRGG
jgi:hypothetical protein